MLGTFKVGASKSITPLDQEYSETPWRSMDGVWGFGEHAVSWLNVRTDSKLYFFSEHACGCLSFFYIVRDLEYSRMPAS